MDQPLVVHRETQIAAPPATVFAFLTDPQKIMSWMGAEAATEAHPGGLYLVKDVAGRPDRTARGQFREVVPVHRLAYSFGWEGDDEVPPGSGLVEIDLLDRDGGTLVRMTHTGLPNAAQCAGHARGWAYYLDRLGVAAAAAIRASTEGPPATASPRGQPRPDRDVSVLALMPCASLATAASGRGAPFVGRGSWTTCARASPACREINARKRQ